MQIRTVETGRGLGWLLDGFDYFKRDPLNWLGITVVCLIIFVVLNLIPLGGLVFQIVMPILVGGLMFGCKVQDEGGKLEIGHLFAGFSANAGQLVLVGVFYSIGMVVIVVIALIGAGLFGFSLGQFGGAMQSGDVGQIGPNLGLFLIPVLIALAASVPLIMAVWFAPVLVMLGNLNAIEAMQQSFSGCLANIMPFLVYGIVATVLSILATIPLALGWLVLIPMFVAATYIGYKEIFSTVVAAPAA